MAATTGLVSAGTRKGAARAASVETPTACLPAASAMPRAAAIPTRNPVKLPGPTVTAMRSRSESRSAAWFMTRARSGIRASACPRAMAMLSCANTRSGVSMTPAAQTSSAVSIARIRMFPALQPAQCNTARDHTIPRPTPAGIEPASAFRRAGARHGRSDRANLGDLGDEMAQQGLDAVAQRCGRGRAAGARALHGQVDHAVLVAAERDVAAVAGDRRAHAGLDQLLDRGDGLGVIRSEEFLGGGRAFDISAHDRGARHVVFHDRAEDRGLEMLPFARRLGDGDEIAAEKHAAHAGNFEQPFGEGGLGGLFGVGHVERALREYGASGQKFQRCRVRRRFGLNEHELLSWSTREQRPARPISLY